MKLVCGLLVTVTLGAALTGCTVLLPTAAGVNAHRHNQEVASGPRQSVAKRVAAGTLAGAAADAAFLFAVVTLATHGQGLDEQPAGLARTLPQ